MTKENKLPEGKVDYDAVEEKSLPVCYSYRDGNQIIGNTRRAASRVMVGIPTTGLVRMEWVIGRYGQVIPCNWSQTETMQWLDTSAPIDFLVADARNICVYHCLNQGFDWLFFIDHDTIMPPFTILKMNERMIEGKVPVWSGLYFTKTRPAEPLVYRGRGTGYFKDWILGDEVWVDGLPMGCTMIHSSILKELVKVSKPYEVKPGLVVSEVFKTPSKVWFDPMKRSWYTATGTEDIRLCDKIMENDIFRKAGWPEYADKEFPFLIDTEIFCKHIDHSGVQYPNQGEEQEFMKKEDEDEKVA